jgi:hypothetical protein
MSKRDAVSSTEDIPGVPGSRGLMLGDILGSSAGDTWTDPVDRFLLLRAESCGVFRAAGPDDPGRSCGLWVADEIPDDLTMDEGGPGFGAILCGGAGSRWRSWATGCTLTGPME